MDRRYLPVQDRLVVNYGVATQVGWSPTYEQALANFKSDSIRRALRMKKYLLILIVLAVAIPAFAQLARPTGERKTIMHDGTERAYRIHLPVAVKKRNRLSPSFSVFMAVAEMPSSLQGWDGRRWLRKMDSSWFIQRG